MVDKHLSQDELADLSIQGKAFSFNPEQIKRGNALHDKLCQDLSQESNLQEIKALAKELGITVSGKTKKDLCHEIASTLWVFREKSNAELKYEADMYNYVPDDD